MLKRITITAVLTALAVVLKCFLKVALTIPVIGVQVSFGGIFTFFPAVLFGPIYGGVASALTDFLGAMIAPTGAYIPWLTVTAFFGGIIKGLLWMALKNVTWKKFGVAVASLLAVIGIVGVMFTVSLNSDGIISGVAAKQADLPTKAAVETMIEEGSISPLSKAAVSLAKYNSNTEKNPDNYRKYLAGYLNLLTIGLWTFSCAGLVFFGIAALIGRRRKRRGTLYIKVLSTILVSGIAVTTANTFILKAFIKAYSARSVLILWIPRLCEEIIVCIFQALIITVLCEVLIRTPIIKKLGVKNIFPEEDNEKV